MRRIKGRVQGCNHYLAFHRFLPVHIGLAPHFEPLDNLKFTRAIFRKCANWMCNFSDRALDNLEESNLYLKLRASIPLQKAFGLHRPGLAAILRLGIGLRADYPKVPTLLVLYR